ncbi:hypothetical protein [Turicibacter sanguinis]|uniref:hypothetical protein n=1 Tax=Turicibacter sanguinis TaxID=154288 RepID=UPI00189D96AB|nr:hypothetical protein [Turicibacter sanguinis]
MMNTNMMKLYEIAKQAQKEVENCNLMIGEFQKVKPYLNVGSATGTIEKLEDVKTDKSHFMRLHIAFCIKGQDQKIVIKKPLFYSNNTNSEYVTTMSELLENFTPGVAFNKRDLVGKMIDVEIEHEKVNNGNIAVIKKIYKHEKRIEDLAL